MGRWDGAASAYRRSFATLCDGTVDRLLADVPAPLLLDAGCGAGGLAARARAAGRRVLAVDADPTMVALTSRRSTGPACVGALPRLPLPDGAVDGVTANFVVNHVPDPRAAVRELARVTAPGGRVGLTVWPAGPPAWGALVSEAYAAAGVVPVPADRLAPHLDFERSAAGLCGLVEDAGLTCLVAEEVSWTWEVTVDDLWAGIAGGVAAVGRTYLAQSPAVRAAAERALRRVAERHVVDGVLRLGSTAAYAVGHMRAAPARTASLIRV